MNIVGSGGTDNDLQADTEVCGTHGAEECCGSVQKDGSGAEEGLEVVYMSNKRKCVPMGRQAHKGCCQYHLKTKVGHQALL